MLCEIIPLKMLFFLIIILLTLAQNGLMVSKQQSLSHYSVNLISSTQQSPFEIAVPEHLEALGSRLTVQIRRSPHSLFPNINATTSGRSEFSQNEIKPREMYLQLGMHETKGEAVMLTQEKITETISTNWQQVFFDCGWIVKGGKYFVYLLYYPSERDDDGDPHDKVATSDNSREYPEDSSEQHFPTSGTDRFPFSKSGRGSRNMNVPISSRSSHFSFDSVNNQNSSSYNKSNQNDSSKLEYHHPASDIGGSRVRVLAKKSFFVKYPTILFEVPTRLETYTTSAPVTFGLTRTICKPKLSLPSTVLTLTMCSYAASEHGGPSSDHFSSNHLFFPDDDVGENPRKSVNMKSTNKSISSSFQSSSHPFSHSSNGVSPHPHHHREFSRNRERQHRRNNPDRHFSSSFARGPSHSQVEQQNKRQNTIYDDVDNSNNVVAEIEKTLQCQRNVATVFQEPLKALQTEGRVTINVDCQLWGRNATYVVQLRETNSDSIIAQSPYIKVEWSSQFSLELSKSSILRCQGSIRAYVSHPQCILPGRDKIRVYGHETLPVPSFLAPKRVSYIGEQQIKMNNRILSFRCNMFPARFLRFCFQYVNTAVDESVAVVIEKCIPTGPSSKIADGGWSTWSNWSPCSVTCGSGGKRYRHRFCDSPPPTSGANFCQGKAIQEEPCEAEIPCPQIVRRPSSFPLQNGGTRKGHNDPSTVSSVELDASNRDNDNQLQYEGSNRPSFMDFSVLNVSTTPGCECGCILYDLVPTKNYSLVIIISANQSSCADEDEEDHHNFRWILHARNEKDQIRLDIVGMDVQCVTMTFRDGNTTDSNLLEVITASQPSDPIQFEGIYERAAGQRNTVPNRHASPSYPYEDEDLEDESMEESEEDGHVDEDDSYDKGESEDDSTDENMNTKGSTSILRIQSTGPSLSIGTTSDSTKNCSGQFIYFIAYYTTITQPVSGVAERKEEIAGYDLWTFLMVKVMILCFIGIVVCSTFGGCVTKVYRKYKYKELKCFEHDDEVGSLNDEGNEVRKSRRGTLDDASSRCTSITLMSFDYSYWRRLRILRLKYFLLKPRPLDPVTTKIKSFPNTPTVSKKIKENATISTGRNNNVKSTLTGRAPASGDEPISKLQTCNSNDHHNPSVLNKPISLSETNLREKSAVLAVTKNGYELRRTRNKKRKITTQKNDVDYSEERSSSTVNRAGSSGAHPKQGSNSKGRHGSVSDMYGEDGNVSLTSTSVSISMSQSLNGSDTASSNSFATPTPSLVLHDSRSNKREEIKLRSSGIKLLKEQENFKRKAGEKNESIGGKEDCHYQEGSSSLTPPRSLTSSENSHRGILKKRIIRGSDDGKGKVKRFLKHGDSSASVSTIQSNCMSSTCDEDSSRVASRAYLDTDQDFEMDYYDYDVMNAGNIPGSYLGLEPAFVVWNSEVYPHSDDEDVEDDNDKELDRTSSGAGPSLAADTKGIMEDSAYGIEMTPSSSSIGMFSSDASPRKEIGVEETSLDTLKFADDDDDDELGTFEDGYIPGKSMKDSGYSGHGSLSKNATNISYHLGKS